MMAMPFLSSNTQDFIEVGTARVRSGEPIRFLSSNTQDFIEVSAAVRAWTKP